MNRFKYAFLLMLSILTITSIPLSAQKMDPRHIEQLDAIFKKDIPKNAPGAAVAILINGETVYERNGGLADLKKKTIIDKNTRFNIASNGKQFTALAILILENDGKINLNDDMRIYLPSLFKNINDTITIRHLLTHTSGIRDAYDLWSLKGITWWEEKLSNGDAIELLEKQEELNFRPGSMYLYSNSNYIILAEIVSKVAEVDFVEFTSNMFEKLGMHNTSFVSDYKKITPPIGKPYFNFDKWFNYEWTCNIHGDGNLFSSMNDQIIWEKLLQKNDSTFLPKEVIEKSQNLIPEFQNYGYGLEYGIYKGKKYRFHEGSTGAWKATSIRFRNPELTIITLTNSGKITTDKQSRDMADVLLDNEEYNQKIQLGPDAIGDYFSLHQIIGAYEVGSRDVFRFEERDGDLFLLRYGRNDTKLVRESDNVFHQWNDPTFKQEFKTIVEGLVQVTFYHTSHQPYTMTKVTADWSNFEMNELNGRYLNSETNVEFILTYDSDKQYEIQFGNQKLNGILLSPKKLFVDGYIITIGSNDDHSDLLMDGNRIKKVRFKKHSDK